MKSLVDEIQALSESLKSAIVITDGYRVPVYVNREFCNLTGYEADELIYAAPLGRILPAPNMPTEVREKFRDNLRSNYPFQFSINSIRKDGSMYIAGGFLLPFLEPEAGVRLVAIERELESLNSNLFDCRIFKGAVRSICNIISGSELE